MPASDLVGARFLDRVVKFVQYRAIEVAASVSDPASEQCTATSKATRKRCRRRVMGGGPSIVYSGNAKQVKARRQERVAIAEARTAPAVEPVVIWCVFGVAVMGRPLPAAIRGFAAWQFALLFDRRD
jgi:hypothetical protein